MIRAGRITRRRTDADIFFFDQFFIVKCFIFCITPKFFPYFFMQVFSKSFCEPVGQCLQHDLIIIIMLLFKTFNMWFNSMNAYGKCTDMIIFIFAFRSNKICKGKIGLTRRFFDCCLKNSRSI